MSRAVLSTKGVGVRFGGVHALAAVDFEAECGAITAIIGPNGAGKTTLLNVISGMVGRARAPSPSRGATSPRPRPTSAPGRAWCGPSRTWRYSPT